MATVLSKSIYLDIPRCGSTWVEKCLKEHTSWVMELPGFIKYSDLIISPKVFKFTFVRHPLPWHLSMYYLHLKRLEENDMTKGFSNLALVTDYSTFDRFVETFTKVAPFYENYVEDRVRHCNFVGKVENLREDLIKALGEAGEEFSEKAIRDEPKVNVSVIRRKDKRWKEKTVDILWNKYHYTMKSLGYERIPNG